MYFLITGFFALPFSQKFLRVSDSEGAGHKIAPDMGANAPSKVSELVSYQHYNASSQVGDQNSSLPQLCYMTAYPTFKITCEVLVIKA